MEQQRELNAKSTGSSECVQGHVGMTSP